METKIPEFYINFEEMLDGRFYKFIDWRNIPSLIMISNGFGDDVRYLYENHGTSIWSNNNGSIIINNNSKGEFDVYTSNDIVTKDTFENLKEIVQKAYRYLIYCINLIEVENGKKDKKLITIVSKV